MSVNINLAALPLNTRDDMGLQKLEHVAADLPAEEFFDRFVKVSQLREESSKAPSGTAAVTLMTSFVNLPRRERRAFSTVPSEIQNGNQVALGCACSLLIRQESMLTFEAGSSDRLGVPRFESRAFHAHG